MTDLFEEVEEQLRSDRYKQLARKAHMVPADRTTTRIIVRPPDDAARGEQVRRGAAPQVAAVAVVRREAHR